MMVEVQDRHTLNEDNMTPSYVMHLRHRAVSN